jgi:hypothetical protein
MTTSPSQRLVLRDLPLAARLVLSAFLISVGIGYVAALVQLHVQHASPGNVLPTSEDVVRKFHGDDKKPQSQMEMLLTADESLPLTGSGQMSRAFTTRSDNWKGEIKELARDFMGGPRRTPEPEQLARAERELRKKREGERLALLAWIHAGAAKKDYENNKFCLPDELANQPITDQFLIQEDGKPVSPRMVAIKDLIDMRCVKCHTKDGEGKVPLEKYDDLKKYVTVKDSSGAMSLQKLAQSSHVHLLGFAMLYALTGLVFAFTSYPALLRCLVAPLPLVVQVADIACWWLARLDSPYGPHFAMAIPITGAIVAVGLAAHILLSLFDIYGKTGKAVLALLLVAVIGCGLAFDVKGKVENYLAGEKPPAAAEE